MKGIICMNQRRAKRQKAIQNQVNRLNNRLTKLHALSRRLSWYRLVIFLIGGALVFISFFWISENLAWFFTGIAFINFSIIAFYHHRLEKGIRRHQIWLEIKKSQLEGNKLPNWLQTEPPSRSMKNLAAISYGFAAVNFTLFLWHQFGNISPYWMLSLFIYVLFYLSNLKLLKHFFFAFLIHRYRDEIAQQLPQWLTAWENLEASISLANFAYLNPDYVFPEFISDLENKDQPILTAKGLGHPLIPADQIVCNDFSLNKSGEAFIITGSNMSGKSSFLKTMGVNLCLAYAGGPVNTGSFQDDFPSITNCHFREKVAAGKMVFDYKLRPGPCPTTNALKIMRMEGLPVD
jgi:ABC-type multidrug transport system fused ATPase/permease subunit